MAFLPRSKCLLISWLQSLFAVILKPNKIKSVTASTFSPSICHEVMGPDAMILFFEYWVLSQLFHSPLSPLSGSSLVPLHFLPLEWYLPIWGWCFPPAVLIPACASFSPVFLMMYSEYKLNTVQIFYKHKTNTLLKYLLHSDCSHGIKRHLLLGRNAMTNLDSI